MIYTKINFTDTYVIKFKDFLKEFYRKYEFYISRPLIHCEININVILIVIYFMIAICKYCDKC